jgi:hypothetical protein
MCHDREHAVTRNVRFESPAEVNAVALLLRSFIDERMFVPMAALDGPAVGNCTSIVMGYAIAWQPARRIAGYPWRKWPTPNPFQRCNCNGTAAVSQFWGALAHGWLLLMLLDSVAHTSASSF